MLGLRMFLQGNFVCVTLSIGIACPELVLFPHMSHHAAVCEGTGQHVQAPKSTAVLLNIVFFEELLLKVKATFPLQLPGDAMRHRLEATEAA